MIIDNRIIVIKKVTNINELLTKGNLSVLLVRMEGRIAFMENNVESDLLYESEVLLLDISKRKKISLSKRYLCLEHSMSPQPR